MDRRELDLVTLDAPPGDDMAEISCIAGRLLEVTTQAYSQLHLATRIGESASKPQYLPMACHRAVC
jgi:hypothetical protein